MVNVVLLSIDALRADHLPLYGYDRDTAFNLTTFADSASWFGRAYSSSSHTREAVPSLLTGRYPSEAITGDYRLNVPTVAEQLSNHGFATAGFHSNPYLSRAYDYGHGFDRFDDDLYLGEYRLLALAQRAWDKLRNRHYARADEINNRSLEWVDRATEPFFLWNHYMDTHGPYEPPAAYQEHFRSSPVTRRESQQLYHKALSCPGEISEEEHQTLLDLYDGEIRYVDECIGRFLRRLGEQVDDEDLLVIVTSDHGDGFGEHGYYEHPRRLHDELVRIPLIVKGPQFSSGEVSSPVSILDIVPTMYRQLGIPVPNPLPGNPLQEITSDDGELVSRPIISEARGIKHESNLRRYSVRDEGDTIFFEREYGSEVLPDGEGSLIAALRSHLQDHTDAGPLEEEGTVDEIISDRLDALGYKE